MGTKQIRAMVAGAEVVEGQVPARGGEPQPLGSQGLPTGAVNGQQVVQARAGAAQKGLRLKLASDEVLQLVDDQTGGAPERIEVQRVGGDLHIHLPGGDAGAPDVIVESYFSAANTAGDSARLIGQSASGDYFAYNSAAGTTANLGGGSASSAVVPQALGTTAISFGPAGWGILAPLAGIVGGIAVLNAPEDKGEAPRSPASYTGADVRAMTPAQVAALSSADLAALSSDAVAGFEAEDVATFDGADIVALGTRVAALSAAALGALNSGQVQTMSSAQVAALSSDHLATLSAAAVAGFEAEDMTTFDGADIGALSARVADLSTAAMAALTSGQVQAMSSAQVAALSSDHLAALSSTAVAGVEAADVATFDGAYIAALGARVADLSTAVAGFEAEDMATFDNADIAALGAGVADLSTAAMAALSAEQLGATTQAQREALLARDYADPLASGTRMQLLSTEMAQVQDATSADGTANGSNPLVNYINRVTGTDVVSAEEYAAGFTISGRTTAGLSSGPRFYLDNDRTFGNGVDEIGTELVSGSAGVSTSYNSATGEFSVTFAGNAAALRPGTHGVASSGVHRLTVDADGNGVDDGVADADRLFLVASGTASSSDTGLVSQNRSVQDTASQTVFVY